MPVEGEAEIADLLAKVRAGDQQALADLFARHRDKLRRMVQLRLDHRLAGRVSASDVLQEAYIDAVKRIDHYFAKPDGADSACLAACLLGDGTSPSHAAARTESFGRLEDALNQMDPLDREVLALRHFEELSNTETAAILGIQPAAASKRYVRALARLKQILETIPGFGGSNA
jgi:RNA polymerase sigma-70 factor (ECF subfamily)